MSVVEQAMSRLRRKEQAVTTIGSLTKKGPSPADDSALTVHSARHVVIDRATLHNAGYLPDSSKDRQFADYYRQIKRPLIARAMATPDANAAGARLIILASALPGDGKTFTSINLALSMARERDVSIVLVDADVAKPHISRIFGVDQEPGLLEALTEEVSDVESLILATDVPGLSILPAGKPHDGAAELLASERMEQVVARISARDPRRISLFDSPPLLVSSESRALVGVAGQVVLVVRAGKTPRQAVLDAIALVGEGKSLSLVLNQGHVGLSDGYYAYGYNSNTSEGSGES